MRKVISKETNVCLDKIMMVGIVLLFHWGQIDRHSIFDVDNISHYLLSENYTHVTLTLTHLVEVL